MNTRAKLQVQSIIVAGIFCFLASGSMENKPSTKVTAPSDSNTSGPTVETKGSAPDPEIALKCNEASGSGGDSRYLYYGSALKEFFTITSSGSVASRVSLSLADTTNSTFTFDCRELDPDVSASRGCSSYMLRRDSLQLSANHSYSAAMAQARGSDTSTDTFQCQTIDAGEAAQILAQRSQAIQR